MGMILWFDFGVTGSKVKGHRGHFVKKTVLVQYLTYYETHELVTWCEGRV